ncbi:MAG TPA: hypothetical protein VIL42_04700 [Sphingomicrobium sp.]|jgi:hypothetical protein
MRKFALLVVGASLGACTAAPPSPYPYGYAGTSPINDPRLGQLLAGRVAGQPRQCLNASRSADLLPVAGNYVAYRDLGTIYVSRTDGICDTRRSSNTLVTRSVGLSSGPCRGDTAYVVDSGSGMTVGSCTFGDFVPYDRAR